MSVTRILCDKCGHPQAWCACEPQTATSAQRVPESTAGCQSFAAAAGSEISIPFELFSDLTDYAFELRGEWGWKQNERAGNAKEYAELHATASLALELRNKHTTFPNIKGSHAEDGAAHSP